MSKLSKKDRMKLEALERLELLGASSLSRAKILNDWQLTKCIVDFTNETVSDGGELTREEEELIKEFENRYGCTVYYVIQDEGMWPDGCMFPRYSFLYVSKYENEWEMDKEDAIKRCRMVPAYVVNMEEPDCSEITEIGYKAVKGSIINIT